MIVSGFARLRQIACLGAVAIFALLVGCKRGDPNRIQGYIEGEYVYVASPLAGALERLEVKRGDQVKEGDLLFQLECASEKDARDEASRRLAQGRANLEDARKGKRPSEVESIEAQIKQAQAALELSESELARQEKLMRSPGVSTEQDLDRARSARDQNQHLVAQLKADLETARLGSRPDQIAAAEANVRALEAALARAEWDLTQKQQSAPQAGVVFDTLFRQGEWVGSGKPVAVLLPPANVKLRVFVPEPWLGSLHLGDPLKVFVDGATGAVTGKVSFISPRAEYTPPVVYSQDNRNKFVFLVEAVFEPAVATQLHPGQPVDVEMASSKP
ncbi:MAG TPA: HlyD family efflux transporter periplasmic adaptor subunit [Verrucomicrobiae bacterium]|jgi:HlyD family secretion protein|nr:HlyD family efflux transporter periplasmic adaptor subunit [Verrucomicrobiae bacterium]